MPSRKKKKCSGRAYQERLRIAGKLKELKDAKQRKGKKRKKINKEYETCERKTGSAFGNMTNKEESGSEFDFFLPTQKEQEQREANCGSGLGDYKTTQEDKKSEVEDSEFGTSKRSEEKWSSKLRDLGTRPKKHQRSKNESTGRFEWVFSKFGTPKREQKRSEEKSSSESGDSCTGPKVHKLESEFEDLGERPKKHKISKNDSDSDIKDDRDTGRFEWKFSKFGISKEEQKRKEENSSSELGDSRTGPKKHTLESEFEDLGKRPKKHKISKNNSDSDIKDDRDTGRFEWKFSKFGISKEEQKRKEENSSSELGDSRTGPKKHKLESEFEDLGKRPKKHKISKNDSDSDIKDDRDTGRFEWKFSKFGISKEEQKRKEENSSSELGDSRTGPKKNTLKREFEETRPKKHKRSNDKSNSDINDDSDTGKFEWRTRKDCNTKSKPKNNVSDDQNSESESYDDKLKSNKAGHSKKHSSKPKHDREYGERAKPRQYTKRFEDTERRNNSDFETNDGTESETEGSKTETESESNEDTSADDERTIRTDYKAQSSFNIKIDKQDWKRIKPKQGGTVMNQNWTHTFSKAFNEKVPGCVINFKYHKINSCPRFGHYFNAKATCKHPGCAIFSFKICENPEKSKNDIEVNVSVLKPIVNHKPGNPKKRKLSMKNREKVQEKLKTQTASSFHYSEFGQMTGEEINEGNYTKCQTEQVLRKAKSDWNLHDALHQDPFTELVLCQELFRDEDENSQSIKGYVQEISYLPFMVVLYMESSIENAKANIRYGNGVFYLDATGSIVKKIHSDRRVFYYSLVVHGKEGVTVPVLEYLTDHHSTNFITRPLLTFQSLLGQKHRPKRIEVDFSWALIHSVLLAFNCLKISEYLDLCYQQVDQMNTGTTVIHVCCVHMLRAVREKLKEMVKDKALRELLLRLWAVLQNTKSVQQACQIWDVMCLVFGSRYRTERVEEAVETMNVIVKSASVANLDDQICCEDDESNTDDRSQKAGIRERSPYRKFFVLPPDEESEGEDNQYFSREILEYFSKNYMPLYPLWSGCFLEDSLTRDSNAPVEAWMKVLKKDIFMGARNVRVGKFVRVLKPVLKGRLRKNLGDIEKKKTGRAKKTKKRKASGKDIDDADEAEESWRRKQSGKPRTNYFYSPTKTVPVPRKSKTRKTQDAKKKPFKTVGIGIHNIANTCWLNAALQGMASLRGFDCKGDDPVSSETQKVLSTIRNPDGVKTLDILTLRNSIRDNMDNFHIGRQQDSGELIHHLMERNIVNDVNDFTVDIIYTKTCLRCHTQSPKTEKTTIINVELPIRQYVSVKDCLEEHFKGEVVREENAIYCVSCLETTAHETTGEFSRINKGLVILVKRFAQASHGKLLKNIQSLKINRVLGWKGLGVYRLHAALCHLGSSLGCGHYITIAVDDEMKLRRCDDAIVEHVTQSTLSSMEVMQGSYVLFYGEMSQKDVQPLLSECVNDEVANCNGIRLKGTDLESLLPDKWINDQVVNAYMRLLTLNFKDVCALDVFFFHCLVHARPTEKFVKQAFSSPRVLVPALYNHHWSLMVVNLSTKEILVFDSSETENRAPGVMLRKFLERRESMKKGSYKLRIIKNLPKQTGVSDCGVCMCMYAANVAAKKDISFRTTDIPRLRRKMIFELLAEKLL